MILKNELPEILIYHKKKYIILGAMLLFLAVLAVSSGLTLGIAGSAGENPAEVAQDMFQVQNAVYLLPGLAVLGVPALLVYIAVYIGERRFLRVYEKMPQEAKRELYERRAKEKHPGGLMIYEAQGYILFSDRLYRAFGFSVFQYGEKFYFSRPSLFFIVFSYERRKTPQDICPCFL